MSWRPRIGLPLYTRSHSWLLLLFAAACGAFGASRHVVQPKASRDHPAFTTHAHVLSDGGSLAYYMRAGAGPTLVLVPETHGDRAQFQEPSFLAALDPAWRLIVVESRGQGRSWPPPTASQASIEGYADDVLALVRALELTHWYIGGHSLGGMVALEIGGRKPAGLRGVVSLEGWVHHRVQAAAFPEGTPPTEAERAEARRQREERYRSQQWSAAQVAALGQIWRKWERGEFSVRNLDVPLLSVWGDRGMAVKPPRAQLLLPDSGRVQLRWIAGADHYITDPPHAAAVAREITRFVAQVERDATLASTASPGRTVLRQPESAPNLVLIVIDDLGYGDLGCYGSMQHRTPNIDRLAAEGMRFTDFHSNGAVCSPTRVGLLTGQYPQRHGIEAAIGFTLVEGLPLTATTMAEVLAGAGYRCGVFGKWHVGHVTRFGPNDQGFDESYCANNNPDYHSHVSRDGNVDWWKDQKLADERGYLVDRVTHHAVRFIRANRNRPFFLYVPQLAVHFPYQGRNDPPHRTAGRKWDVEKYGPLPKAQHPRAYREMVEAADASVGEIVAVLNEAGVRERTLVFVCSDNGAYVSVGSNGPLRGEKGELFEGGHRVPAIANWPGKVPAGKVSGVTAMTFDLLATFAAIARVPLSAELSPDGVNLEGVLLRGESIAPRTLFWRDADESAVRRGEWKLVVRHDGMSLFNLALDAAESRDLAAKEPGRVGEMRAALDGWEKDVGKLNRSR